MIDVRRRSISTVKVDWLASSESVVHKVNLVEQHHQI